MREFTLKTEDIQLWGETLEKYPVTIGFKLDEILKKRKMTQLQLSQLTGIRHSTICDIVNSKKSVINVLHLILIMSALRITDVKELLVIEYAQSTKDQWQKEMKGYGKGLTATQQQELNYTVEYLTTRKMKVNAY